MLCALSVLQKNIRKFKETMGIGSNSSSNKSQKKLINNLVPVTYLTLLTSL